MFEHSFSWKKSLVAAKACRFVCASEPHVASTLTQRLWSSLVWVQQEEGGGQEKERQKEAELRPHATLLEPAMLPLLHSLVPAPSGVADKRIQASLFAYPLQRKEPAKKSLRQPGAVQSVLPSVAGQTVQAVTTEEELPPLYVDAGEALWPLTLGTAENVASLGALGRLGVSRDLSSLVRILQGENLTLSCPPVVGVVFEGDWHPQQTAHDLAFQVLEALSALKMSFKALESLGSGVVGIPFAVRRTLCSFLPWFQAESWLWPVDEAVLQALERVNHNAMTRELVRVAAEQLGLWQDDKTALKVSEASYAAVIRVDLSRSPWSKAPLATLPDRSALLDGGITALCGYRLSQKRSLQRVQLAAVRPDDDSFELMLAMIVRAARRKQKGRVQGTLVLNVRDPWQCAAAQVIASEATRIGLSVVRLSEDMAAGAAAEKGPKTPTVSSSTSLSLNGLLRARGAYGLDAHDTLFFLSPPMALAAFLVGEVPSEDMHDDAASVLADLWPTLEDRASLKKHLDFCWAELKRPSLLTPVASETKKLRTFFAPPPLISLEVEDGQVLISHRVLDAGASFLPVSFFTHNLAPSTLISGLRSVFLGTSEACETQTMDRDVSRILFLSKGVGQPLFASWLPLVLSAAGVKAVITPSCMPAFLHTSLLAQGIWPLCAPLSFVWKQLLALPLRSIHLRGGLLPTAQPQTLRAEVVDVQGTHSYFPLLFRPPAADVLNGKADEFYALPL